MGPFGPNDAEVRRLLDRVRELTAEDVQAILDARIE